MLFLFDVEHGTVVERPLGHVCRGLHLLQVGPKGGDVGQLDQVPEIVDGRRDDGALADFGCDGNGHFDQADRYQGVGGGLDWI
jgi:hypothetical protein